MNSTLCSTPHRALLLLWTVALGGWTNDARVPDPSAPSQDKGVVILSVTVNSGEFPLGAIGLKPESEDPEGNKYQVVLQRLSQGMGIDTALFVGELPPGDYRFDTLYTKLSWSQKGPFITLGDGAKQNLGLIRISAGKVHDLGRLVLASANLKFVTGRSAHVTSNADQLKRMVPTMAKLLDGPAAPGWVEPRGEKDLVEKYALSRPIGVRRLVELDGGEVAAASRLGTILVRRPDGQWRGIQTGSLDSLYWIKAAPDDGRKLVAVGELNAIVEVDRAGKSRRLGSGNLPPGTLTFVDGDDTTGWFVAHVADDKVTLYHSMRLGDGEWKAFGTEALAKPFWENDRGFLIGPTREGFAYYSRSRSRLMFYAWKTGIWKERYGQGTVKSIRFFADGSVGVEDSDCMISSDEGKFWSKLETPYNSGGGCPGVARDGHLIIEARTFRGTELKRSVDGGKTWSTVREKWNQGNNLVGLPTTGLFAIGEGQFGWIARSEDDGATWTLEYTTYDRSIEEPEKPKAPAPAPSASPVPE